MDNQEKYKEFNEIIDFDLIFKKLVKSKLKIFIITSFFAISSIIIALSINDLYTSDMIVEEVDSEGDNMHQSNIGSIGPFSGFSIANQQKKTKTVIAKEVITTRDFFDELSKDDTFMIELLAIEGFDNKTGNLIYNEEVYDIEDNKLKPVFLDSLSYNEIHQAFLNSISWTELESGSTKIAVTHLSPYVAKDWLDKIFITLNDSVKNISVTKANKSLDYLNEQLIQSNAAELTKLISALIEKEIKTLMLAEVSEYFVFSIVDSPRVPEEKSYPHRAMICIIITMVGFLLACLISLLSVKSSFLSKKEH